MSSDWGNAEDDDLAGGHSTQTKDAIRRNQSAEVMSKLLPPPAVSPKRQGSLLNKVAAVVCGDLGGTNSRLELFRIEKPDEVTESALKDIGKQTPLYRNSYKNSKIDGDFTQVMHQFLEDSRLPHVELVAGCLAVAGPVENDRVNFTNLNWVIDSRHLEQEFFMPANSMRLVNDFVANGYGVVTLEAGTEYDDISPHGPVESVEGAVVACVGAGTGLGETFATKASCDEAGFTRYDAWPSEGGHVAFAPRDALQRDLLSHLAEKFHGRVSTERVVSGKGIVNVYEFLADKKMTADIDPKIDQRIRTENEGAALVSRSAYDNPICAKTMDIVLDAYGAEVGNAAVKWIPRGGLYIAGGIAGKNIERIRPSDSPFMEAFLDRGRLRSLIPKIPLRLVTVDDLGLRGAHYVAISILAERNKPPPPPPNFLPDFEDDAPVTAAKKDDAQPLDRLESALTALSQAVLLGSSTIATSLIAASLLLVLVKHR